MRSRGSHPSCILPSLSLPLAHTHTHTTHTPQNLQGYITAYYICGVNTILASVSSGIQTFNSRLLLLKRMLCRHGGYGLRTCPRKTATRPSNKRCKAKGGGRSGQHRKELAFLYPYGLGSNCGLIRTPRNANFVDANGYCHTHHVRASTTRMHHLCVVLNAHPLHTRVENPYSSRMRLIYVSGPSHYVLARVLTTGSLRRRNSSRHKSSPSPDSGGQPVGPALVHGAGVESCIPQAPTSVHARDGGGQSQSPARGQMVRSWCLSLLLVCSMTNEHAAGSRRSTRTTQALATSRAALKTHSGCRSAIGLTNMEVQDRLSHTTTSMIQTAWRELDTVG
jgi:hypothetical protein